MSYVTVSALHSRALPQARESQAKRCFHISHHTVLHRTAHCALTPSLAAEQVTAHFVDPRFAARANCTATEHSCLLQAVAGREEIYLRTSEPFLFVCLWRHGILCNVISDENPRDVVQNHAETRTSAYIYHGDAASFHEWKFRTRFYVAGNTGVQHIEAMSKVCDGLRGDAFVAAQEVGFDNLREITDGRPRGIEALINMRETFFPSTEYESKRLFCQHCCSEGPLSGKLEKGTACLAATT